MSDGSSSQWQPQSLWALAQQLIEPCQQAAAAILDVYQAEAAPEVAMKSDETPVTEADHESHHILVEQLKTLTPELPILSEEGHVPNFERRQQWHSYWLIDPLDGTREFINRTGEFTINIALIEAGRAVLGVIAVPVDNTLYLGVPGYGASRYQDGQHTPIQTANIPSGALRVLTGGKYRSTALSQCFKQLEQQFGETASIRAGSALKFCHLAEGRGDIYPRFARCSEWDTAAGQALLEAAGGAVVGLDFEPLQYNTKASLISPYFYALADLSVAWETFLHSRDNP